MTRESFFQTLGGRVFAATSALALFFAAWTALAGTGPEGALLPTVVMLCVLGCVFAVGVSLDSSPSVALVLVLALPPVGGLYFAGLTVAGELGAATGVALMALGALAAWIAVRSGARAPELREARSEG